MTTILFVKSSFEVFFEVTAEIGISGLMRDVYWQCFEKYIFFPDGIAQVFRES